MDKNVFNKIVKQQIVSYGFAKTGPYDYAKDAQDGITKIVLRAPNMVSGFFVGVQFKDYGDFSGKYSKTCMKYKTFELELCIASIKNYSEKDIIKSVKTVMNGIDIYLREGRNAIRENIDQWEFALFDEKKQNEIYAYLGLPLIDPYSDSYIIKQIENWHKQGGVSVMSLDEYYNHKDHYDKYAEKGCDITIGKDSVTISFDRNRNTCS